MDFEIGEEVIVWETGDVGVVTAGGFQSHVFRDELVVEIDGLKYLMPKDALRKLDG